MTLLTDIFKDVLMPKVVEKLGKAVLFEAGHYEESVNRIDKLKNNIGQTQVYPLVWLVMDFKQEHDTLQPSYEVPRTRLFIVAKSDGNSSSLERIENVFKPVLIPIWEELQKQILYSYSIGTNKLEFDLTLHPYAQGLGERGNLFNDTVDCIEVSNLSLTVQNSLIC